MMYKLFGVFAALALVVGCGGGDEDNKPKSNPGNTGGNTNTTNQDGNTKLSDYDGKGVTVKGVVTIKGDVPAAATIDVTANEYCKKVHQNKPLLAEDVVAKSGKLANVFVVVTPAPKLNYPVPMETKVLNQHECHYVPHVLGLQKGQKLLLRNSDGDSHNVNKAPSDNGTLNKLQPKGSPDLEFTATKVALGNKREKFGCDIHSWMGAWVYVADHPFFAVTDDDGSFEIKNLPPGEYTFEAWHEVLGKKTAKAKVPSDQPVTFEFEAPK